MIVIEVKSSQTESQTLKGAKGDWTKKFQYGFIELNGERRRLQLGVREGAAPYQPGMYTLDDTSFEVGKYGNLELNRFELKLKQIPAKAA